MKSFKNAILFIAIALLSSCGQEVIQTDRHFAGIWNGIDGTITYRLSIDNGSNGYWNKKNRGNSSTAQGIARIKHDKLYVGAREFDINRFPTADSTGAWTMNLSGIDYTKQ